MAEQANIPLGSKEEIYRRLFPQVEAIMDRNVDMVANMANVASCLKEAFDFWWVGFYRVIESQGHHELVLGPFQGPLACTRISYGRGVCGTAWREKKTIIVPDVNQFPGHIACSSASRSEIVVPVLHGQDVIAVLDIDSCFQNSFDAIDKCYLERLVELF